MATVDIPVLVGSTLTQPFEVPILLQITEDAKPPKGYGMFRIMNPKDGDKRVVWNNDSLGEIQAAKQMFDDLKHEGLQPYKVGKGAKPTSEVMEEFDPMAEEVVFLPKHTLLAGG